MGCESELGSPLSKCASSRTADCARRSRENNNHAGEILHYVPSRALPLRDCCPGLFRREETAVCPKHGIQPDALLILGNGSTATTSK
jgi:hypothetical protein